LLRQAVHIRYVTAVHKKSPGLFGPGRFDRRALARRIFLRIAQRVTVSAASWNSPIWSKFM
jgi:hypothetical protein